ncbi:MAG: hypothetical protein INR73_29345, partial [Williamsia sp.]|nr:hypothetical protein [Williamsia sp.]
GIGENIIYRWRSRHHNRQLMPLAAAGSGTTVLPVAVPPDDTLALHKRIHELEMERDILKKALAIFSRPA